MGCWRRLWNATDRLDKPRITDLNPDSNLFNPWLIQSSRMPTVAVLRLNVYAENHRGQLGLRVLGQD